MRKFLVVSIAVVSSVLMASAGHATDFTFSFNAPYHDVYETWSDAASGSGTFTTDEADVNGNYKITGVSGTWISYQPDLDIEYPLYPDVKTISNFDSDYAMPPFQFADAGQDVFIHEVNGAYVIDGISLYNDDYSDAVSLYRNQDGSYYRPTFESISDPATLTIAAAAASPTPEAATWAMMLVGFGAIGAALRDRRVKVRFV